MPSANEPSRSLGLECGIRKLLCVVSMVLAATVVVSGTIRAQAPDAPTPPPTGDGSSAPEAPVPEAPAEAPAEANAEEGQEIADASSENPSGTAVPDARAVPPPADVELSFQNAKIELLVKWLGEVTGKTIIKHPTVKCQLNVMSSKKRTLEQALRMVYNALSLEGFAAVETSDTIYLVPEKDAGKIAPEWSNGDDERLKGKQRVVKIFKLDHSTAAKLKSKLQNVLSTDAKIEVDDQANRLIITDHADNLHLAREFIRELDVPAVGDSKTDVITLKHAKADQLSTILTKVFSESAAAGGDSSKDSPPPPPGAKGARFVPDSVTNSLIVTSTQAQYSKIESLIAKLDTAKPADLAVRVLPLKYIQASDLVDDLNTVFGKGGGSYNPYGYSYSYSSSRRRSSSSSGEIREISAHEGSNSLIILSNKSDFDSIKALVESLDIKGADANIMKIVPLKNADAEDIAEQLTDLYDSNPMDRNSYNYSNYYYYSRRYGDQGNSDEKIQFVADRRRNAIIVLAPAASMEKVEDMIAILDAPVDGEELVPLILPLKYVRAFDMEDVLNTLFLKKTTQQSRYYWDDVQTEERDIGRLYGKVRITSESYTNSLIVASNSQENLDAIKKLVSQMDVSSPNGETTLSFPLKYARASAVANNINILFAQIGAGPRRPTQQQQQRNQQQQQQNTANALSQQGFEIEEKVVEESYFPWLGGSPQNTRQTSSGRQVRMGSDLVGRVRVVPDTRTNSLLITTNAHLFPPVVELVNDLDMPTAQVLIEAKIIEILQEDALRLGTRWSPDGAEVFETDDLDNSFLGEVGAEYIDVFGSGLVEANIDLDVLMQFLQKYTDTRIRADPRINVADNERGKLFVGSRIPFITESRLSPEATRNDSFEYINVGITLEVTPRINTDNEVALGIRVETSKMREGETLFGGAIIDTRNYRTELTVQNGQTAVLGGMIQKVQQEIERKVPILGDIPLLGWFFKKKDTSVTDFEIMVFLQPHVTRTPEEADRLRAEEERRARSIYDWNREAEQEALEEDEGAKERLEEEMQDLEQDSDEGPLPQPVTKSELAGK